MGCVHFIRFMKFKGKDFGESCWPFQTDVNILIDSRIYDLRWHLGS